MTTAVSVSGVGVVSRVAAEAGGGNDRATGDPRVETMFTVAVITAGGVGDRIGDVNASAIGGSVSGDVERFVASVAAPVVEPHTGSSDIAAS